MMLPTPSPEVIHAAVLKSYFAITALSPEMQAHVTKRLSLCTLPQLRKKVLAHAADLTLRAMAIQRSGKRCPGIVGTAHRLTLLGRALPER